MNKMLEILAERDPRYHPEAYRLVLQAMDRLREKWAKEGRRDFRAWEVMDAFREVALDQFGPMALMVLEEWGVRSSRDIGQLVFNLVEVGLLGKSPEDRIEDFNEGFDFEEAFRKPFLAENEE